LSVNLLELAAVIDSVVSRFCHAQLSLLTVTLFRFRCHIFTSAYCRYADISFLFSKNSICYSRSNVFWSSLCYASALEE